MITARLEADRIFP